MGSSSTVATSSCLTSAVLLLQGCEFQDNLNGDTTTITITYDTDLVEVRSLVVVGSIECCVHNQPPVFLMADNTRSAGRNKKKNCFSLCNSDCIVSILVDERLDSRHVMVVLGWIGRLETSKS